MEKMKNYESPFTFINSNVKKLNIENHLTGTKFDEPPERGFSMDYSLHSLPGTEEEYFGVVQLCFQIILSYRNEQLLKFDAEIFGLFKCGKKDLTKDNFQNMLEYNGVTALYGISRGIFTSISSVAFPDEVIRLPMLNIAQIVREKHEHDEKNKS